MRVFVVMGEIVYGPVVVVAVFSSRVKAEAFIKEEHVTGSDGFYINYEVYTIFEKEVT